LALDRQPTARAVQIHHRATPDPASSSSAGRVLHARAQLACTAVPWTVITRCAARSTVAHNAQHLTATAGGDGACCGATGNDPVRTSLGCWDVIAAKLIGGHRGLPCRRPLRRDRRCPLRGSRFPCLKPAKRLQCSLATNASYPSQSRRQRQLTRPDERQPTPGRPARGARPRGAMGRHAGPRLRRPSTGRFRPVACRPPSWGLSSSQTAPRSRSASSTGSSVAASTPPVGDEHAIRRVATDRERALRPDQAKDSRARCGCISPRSSPGLRQPIVCWLTCDGDPGQGRSRTTADRVLVDLRW